MPPMHLPGIRPGEPDKGRGIFHEVAPLFSAQRGPFFVDSIPPIEKRQAETACLFVERKRVLRNPLAYLMKGAGSG
jgi:hypothetical protein